MLQITKKLIRILKGKKRIAGKKISLVKHPVVPVAVAPMRLRKFVNYKLSARKRSESVCQKAPKTEAVACKPKKLKRVKQSDNTKIIKTAGTPKVKKTVNTLKVKNDNSAHAIAKFFKKCQLHRKRPKVIEELPQNAEVVYVQQGMPLPPQASQKSQGNDDEVQAVSVKKIDLRTSDISRNTFLNNDARSKEDLKNINLSYPLTPFDPKKGEKVYAWCNIKYAPEENALVYKVIEPPLTEFDKKKLRESKRLSKKR